MALVINEAIACELPVIATSVVGAAVELIRHRENGLIVSPRSVEAMTDAIWEITKTDRYLEMKAGCLQCWICGVVRPTRWKGYANHCGILAWFGDSRLDRRRSREPDHFPAHLTTAVR